MRLNVYQNDQLIHSLDLEALVAKGNQERFSCFIGRAPDCKIVMGDVALSRYHLEIIWEKNNWKIKNLSPFTPLLHRGKSISELVVDDNTQLKLLNYEIQFQNVVRDSEVTPASKIELAPQVMNQGDTTEVNDEMISEELEKPVEDVEMGLPEIESNEFQEQVTPDLDQQTNAEISSESDDQSFELSLTQGSQLQLQQENFDSTATSTLAQDDLMGAGDGDDATQRAQTFLHFKLYLEGPVVPFDLFVLEKDNVLIGRDENQCDITLPDEEVSTVHAAIKKVGGEFHLQDLGSSNGTYVQGMKVNKAVLKDKDQIKIGSSNLTFVVQSPFVEEQKDRLMPVQVTSMPHALNNPGLNNNPLSGFSTAKQNHFGATQVNGNFQGQDFAPVENENPSIIKKFLNNKELRNRSIMYGGVVALLWFLLSDEAPQTESEPPPEKKVASVNKTEEVKPPSTITENVVQNFSPEERETLEGYYLLSTRLAEEGKYRDALVQLENIFRITPNYKNAKALENLIKKGLKELEENERLLREKEELAIRNEKIQELLKKAQDALENKEYTLIDGLMVRLNELDPNNSDVSDFKFELEASRKADQERKVQEEVAKAERARQESELQLGKDAFLKKDWYAAKTELGKYVASNGRPEDLLKEAVEMLEKASQELDSLRDPLIAKAKNLKDGADLKGAYETYQEVLSVDPSYLDATIQINSIKEEIELKVRKIYREAMVSESLSLFDDAKERLYEVQQLAPTDSVYYRRASDKLKEYLY